MSRILATDRNCRSYANRRRALIFFCLITTCLTINPTATSQKNAPSKKLPSAEKIVDNYLKAIGGKKKVATIRDASYEFVVQLQDRPIGLASLQRKTPGSERWEIKFGNGQIISAANASSAWEQGMNGPVRTLTATEGAVAKLRAMLDASHLYTFKKMNVAARVTSVENVGTESAYVVEFATRSGAKIRYTFSIKSGLLLKVTDESSKAYTMFEDYRSQQGILEPHKIRMEVGQSGELVLLLQNASYNSKVEDRIFDPPAANLIPDVADLLRQVAKNQDEVEKRVAEYSYLQKETDREIGSKGEIKKETTKVYEIYPLPNREPVQKLISENGVALSPDRAAKEEKRILEELEKAERNREKDAAEVARKKAEREKKNKAAGREADDDPEISQFLKVCEFVSPRREQYDGRDAVIFDFRLRPGFRPSNREESLIAKLVGVVWIDPVDKQVIRLEARLAEAFKLAGGLVVSLRPGAALVMEQTRISDGLWLPRFAQINLSIKVFLFGGGDVNKTIEWSQYQHFSGNVKDYKIDSPKPTQPSETKKP